MTRRAVPSRLLARHLASVTTAQAQVMATCLYQADVLGRVWCPLTRLTDHHAGQVAAVPADACVRRGWLRLRTDPLGRTCALTPAGRIAALVLRATHHPTQETP